MAPLPRALRVALAAAAVLAFLALAWVLAGGPGDGRRHVVVHRPVTFNLFYAGGLQRAAPRPGELLRLQTPRGAASPQSFTVRPLRLAPYRGDVTAYLTVLAASLVERMRADVPGFVWRGDGRVAVNRQPGYQISFQTRVAGRTVYGRRVLLVATPDPPPREGVDITMLATRSTAVPSIDDVGGNGQLKSPYRTLHFGTATS
jgi:hypothetical protein